MEHRDLENEVLEYLRWNPNSRPSDIADALGVSPKLIRIVLTKLRRKGLVYRTSRGYVVRLVDSDRHSSEPIQVEQNPTAIGFASESSSIESVASGRLDAVNSSLDVGIPTESSAISPVITQSTGDTEACYSQLDELRERMRRVERVLRELTEYLSLALQSIAIGDREALHRVLSYLQDIAEELNE